MQEHAKRLDRRRSYVLKLRPNKDQDLIEWLDSIPDGLRQEVMRAALRTYAGEMAAGRVKADRLTQLVEDSAWLKQALEDMPAWFDSKLAALAVAGPILPPPEQPDSSGVDDAPRLSDEEIERRDRKMKKAAQW